ncbi:MAG: hypothetical protein AAFY07_09745 [Pseudomonadota bacterium]
MAFIQTKRAGMGELLTGTFAHLALIWREIAVYFGVFLVIGLISDALNSSPDLAPLTAIIGLAAIPAYFAGQYWLYRAAFKRLGAQYDPRFKVFSMFVMAVILGLAISIGMNFLIVPGLILAAKWVMAPSFLVAQERSFFDAMGDAWHASSGNSWQLTGAFTVLCVIWSVAFSFLVTLIRIGDTVGPARINAFEWLTFHILPVLLLGLSVAAYRLLAEDDTSLVEVFE